jgi:thioredoxin
MYKLLSIIGITVLLSACTEKQTQAENELSGSKASAEEVSKKAGETAPADKRGKVVYLSTETFKQKVFNYEVNKEWKYNGDKPAIVDFYADWCRPCKIIAPILDELATEYADDIVIYKVDTEKHKELSAAFGIRSIPSLLFIPVNGQPQMAQGALPKESLVKAIDEVLLKKQ